MPRIAIVGATGAVGEEFARILCARRVPVAEVRLLASARSAGRRVAWAGESALVETLAPDSFQSIELALFSAGAAVSREYAPAAVAAGALVIDNSSAFRMDPNVPLVVPEVNPAAARDHRGIIANPNCSTIILLLALAPLHRAAGVRRAVISTYQAVSGAGARALAELEQQTRDVLDGRPAQPSVFREPCAFNVFSHNSEVGEDGRNGEERKIVEESRKILDAPALAIAVTCMRVPVQRAHSEAVWLELERPLTPDAARRLLASAPGVRVIDEPRENRFPTPLRASGQDDVLVGRIRADASVPDGRGLQLLVCGDQLRKGAALNAIQIADLLLGRPLGPAAALAERGP